ncbi:MAG: hypothetical protein RLZZ15_4266, partial [Verrucomicrobiota bacterium]
TAPAATPVRLRLPNNEVRVFDGGKFSATIPLV